MSSQLRKDRTAQPDASLIVIKTDQGYKVKPPYDHTKNYLVTIIEGRLHCTCSDYQIRKSDPTYSCKHIAAVIEYDNSGGETNGNPDIEPPPDYIEDPTQEAWQEEYLQTQADAGGLAEAESWFPPPALGLESPIISPAAHMLIKRSLSPDGRIDSISVELDFPVDPEQPEAIKAKAGRALRLQTEIVREYISGEARPVECPAAVPNATSIPAPTAANIEGEQALLKDIGSMQSRWGKRFFINVEVSGKVLRLFGTDKQLSAYIADAGYAVPVSQIIEGKTLNLRCRAITKPSPDGRYVNVERLMEEKRSRQVS